MDIYEGQLKKLGIARMSSDQVRYSLVEVGEEIIQKLTVNNKLDSFLEAGLKTTEPTKLWVINMGLAGKGLAGVQVADGKVYMSAPFSFFSMFFINGLLALGGLGAVFSGEKGLAFLGCVLIAQAAWIFNGSVINYLRIPKDGAKVL